MGFFGAIQEKIASEYYESIKRSDARSLEMMASSSNYNNLQRTLAFLAFYNSYGSRSRVEELYHSYKNVYKLPLSNLSSYPKFRNRYNIMGLLEFINF